MTRADWMRDAIQQPTDECILWPFAITAGGYGTLRYLGRQVAAHHAVCEMVRGPPAACEIAIHSCRNRHCINPRHVSWGTHQQNNADDRIRDGTLLRGSHHGRSRLTEQDVLAIRASALSGVELAVMYGVTPKTISAVRRRQSWRHL